MQRFRGFIKEYHPIIHTLVLGTVLARAAASMSLPFLALYLARHTGIDKVTIGFITGASAFAGMIGGFIGGALSDRFGRKRIMMSALYAWAVVFLGFSVAAGPLWFLLLNMVNGVCRSFYEPVSQALMADLTTPEKRMRVFSMRYLAINVGVAVGPLAGAYLGTVSGPLPFRVTAMIYLIYAVALHVLLNRFGIKRIEGEKKEQVTIRSAWQVVRRDRVFRRYVTGGILGAVGYSQMTVTLSQYIDQHGYGGGMNLFAVLMTVNAVAVVALQLPLSRLMEKRPAFVSIVLGNLFFALGDAGFALSGAAWAFVGSMVLFTLGEILNYPAANMLIDGIAPKGMRGTYYGAQSFQNLGHFLGPIIGGFMLASLGGEPLFLTMAVVTLGGTYFYGAGQRVLKHRMVQVEQSAEGPAVKSVGG